MSGSPVPAGSARSGEASIARAGCDGLHLVSYLCG